MSLRCWFIAISTWVVTLHTQPAQAKEYISTDSISLVRSGDVVQLVMRIDVDRKQIGKDDVLLVAPQLTASKDSAAFPSVGVYGRNTYYYNVRAGRIQLQEPGAPRLRAKDTPMPVIYAATLKYEPWMDFASVKVRITTDRFCDGIVQETERTVLQMVPQVIVTPPKPEAFRPKSINKKAYVDFIVNRTEIKPDYHDNRNELARIKNTIDSVNNDPTTRLVGIHIKGWASPEGPYDNNIRLAKGRSNSLRQYMIDNYGIDPTRIKSEYEPEDWPGLRDSVERSNLPHREEMLRIIDSDEEPDARLRRIKVKYPKEYLHILKNFMPYLRHSDYRIDYEQAPSPAALKPRVDSVWALPPADRLTDDSPKGFIPFKPDFALKTNLLFDAAGAFNFEVEIPFGRNRQWSIMLEDWFPWYVWHNNSRAYEIWTVGAELRRWFDPCPGKRPALTGNFVGLYAALGKYDIEWKSVGDQGEFTSF
ncbi:MAG: DUF3575 domain-containing protein [Prevotella sp.]|nr:DUF3575 domain-containing protein [Prevotella sp.]